MGYIIFLGQCKMNKQEPLFETYEEFQDSDS